MTEIWKDIQDYEGLYQVSNFGKVKSLDRKILCKNNKHISKTGKLNKHLINEKGYVKISLSKNNKSKCFKLHRLVAIHFIENSSNLPEVNHIDGNKLNNSIENLEWINRLDNMRHAYANGLCINCVRRGSENNKSKKVIDKSNNNIYESIREAAVAINLQPGTLQAMLSGKNPNRTSLDYHV